MFGPKAKSNLREENVDAYPVQQLRQPDHYIAVRCSVRLRSTLGCMKIHLSNRLIACILLLYVAVTARAQSALSLANTH